MSRVGEAELVKLHFILNSADDYTYGLGIIY
jgi:hypothetical protein